MGPQKKMTEAERKERERLRKAAARAISGVDRVVSASQDQGSLIYGEDAGSQCTCMALMAAVYAYEKSPTEWTTRDLDALMDSGNTLYGYNRGSRSFLLINELPKQVYLDKARFTVNFPQNGENYCGTINRQTTKQPFYSLKDALTCAGNVSKCHFVVMGAPKCAYASMVIDMGDEGYFIFDSHSRDEHGLFAINGKGVLVKLKTLNAAVAYIKQLTCSMALTSNTYFEVVPCVIAKKETDTEVFFTSMTEFFSKTELMRKKKREIQAEWLKNEGVKKQRKERESSQRAEPKVKKQRKERESSQRAMPEVKKQRKDRESKQRAKPVVKEKRKIQREQQGSNPTVKKQRKERESSQRAEPEVKKQRNERESSQRAEPEVKKQRKERESSQRAEPQVKKQQKERESSQRAEPEVKQQRKERESSQRAEPQVKKQRKERESSQRAEPEVKKQRKERESSQRAEPEVKKQRKERESSQRSDPNVKRVRQTREAEQRADPVIKQQRCQKRKDLTEKREENIEFIAQRFKANCSEIPEYICCVCNRIRFRTQVQKYLDKKYDQKLHHLNIRKDDESLWVCTSCHRHLLKNKVPPMSVVAHDLNPTELPNCTCPQSAGNVETFERSASKF